MSDNVPESTAIDQAFENCRKSPETVGRFGEAWANIPDLPTPDPAATERFFQDLRDYLSVMEQGHPYHGRRYLQDADESAGNPPTPRIPFWDLTGKTVLQHALYVRALHQRAALWGDLKQSASRLESFYHQCETVSEVLRAHVKRMEIFLTQCVAYLDRHEQWGVTDDKEVSLRERLVRRLGALKSLVLVIYQQETQAQLAQQQVLHHLDLFYRVRDVLLPVYQQHESGFHRLPKPQRRSAWRHFCQTIKPLRVQASHPAKSASTPAPVARQIPTPDHPAGADPQHNRHDIGISPMPDEPTS